MTTLTVKFTENAQGNVEVDVLPTPTAPVTQMEHDYVMALSHCVANLLPKLGEHLGAKAAIFREGNPKEN